MELVQELYDFFGIELISQSATFIDLINAFLQVGLSVWLTVFVIRSVFLLCTVPDRRLF